MISTDLSFEITGPDDDGFVWLHTEGGNHVVNLGPVDDAIETMSRWLASVEES